MEHIATIPPMEADLAASLDTAMKTEFILVYSLLMGAKLDARPPDVCVCFPCQHT